MIYTPKKFDNLIGTPGFSETILKNHFTLYEGYVTNFNKLDQTLMAMEKEGKFGTPEFNELNRRFGWEFNGMRLHELYFENMAKKSSNFPNEGQLADRILSEWGSHDLFRKDFTAMGAMRGIGWVILYHDPVANRLFNVWVNEHDMGHLAGCKPLLVLDVFEHAYTLDYGLKKTDYIEAFFKAIDWNTVAGRFTK
ncbi:MAG: superoxide dismutase [Candidatus Colwellbacteria bacterium]|nr:superoxide dismutase [Candidatus Colwellbacteria bacterium]